MCTGRIDLSFILRSLTKGADGVMIGGCWPGECHYVTEGNFDALANMHMCKKLLEKIGLRPERLRLEWVAASEGSRFAEVMSDFVQQLKDLGPLGKPEGIEDDALKVKLQAASRLLPYLKLVEREKLRAPTRSEEAYNKFYGSEEVNLLFDELVSEKLAISQILLHLGGGPLSSAQISEKVGLSSSDVAQHMKSSSRQGLITFDREHGTYALA